MLENYDLALSSFYDDLKEYPINGWGLYGVYQSMAGLPDKYSHEEVDTARQKAETSFIRSDVRLETPCQILF
jgi:hypothetical protein